MLPAEELRALPFEGTHGVPSQPSDCTVNELLERIEQTLAHEKEYEALSASAKSYLGYLRSARDRAIPYVKKGDWGMAKSKLSSVDRYIGYIERRVATARSSFKKRLETLTEPATCEDLVNLAVGRHKLGIDTNTIPDLMLAARKAAETTKDWQTIANAQLRDFGDKAAGSNSLMEAESHISGALELESLAQSWGKLKNQKHQRRLIIACIEKLANGPIPDSLKSTNKDNPRHNVVNRLVTLLQSLQRMPRDDTWSTDFQAALDSVIPLAQTPSEILKLIGTVERAVLPGDVAVDLQKRLVDRGVSMIRGSTDWYSFILGIPVGLRNTNQHVMLKCLETIEPGEEAVKICLVLANSYPEESRKLVADSVYHCKSVIEIYRLLQAMQKLEFDPIDMQKQLDRLVVMIDTESDYRYLAYSTKLVFQENSKALFAFIENAAENREQTFAHHHNMATAYVRLTPRDYVRIRHHMKEAEKLTNSHKEWEKLGFFHSCWLNDSVESQRCYAVSKLLGQIERLKTAEAKAKKEAEAKKEAAEEDAAEPAPEKSAKPHSEKL